MTSKNFKIGFIILTIAGIALGGAMLLLTWNQEKPHELLIDLGKTGASLSLISVVGGIVPCYTSIETTTKELLFYNQ